MMMEGRKTTATVRRTKESNNSTNNDVQRIHAVEKSFKNNENNIDSDSLTLWSHPITTLNYFIRELLIDTISLTKRTFEYKKSVWSLALFIGLFFALRHVAGPHQQVNI